MEDFKNIIIFGLFTLIFNNVIKKKREQYGGSKQINLQYVIESKEINLIEINSTSNSKIVNSEIYAGGNIFSPMFSNILEAVRYSPSNSAHLVVPGLMPIDEKWDSDDKNMIYYMPNDIVPHKHGKATHHSEGGFELDRVFLMSISKFKSSTKKMPEYRLKLNNFNNGFNNSPVETWIHWKIPKNKQPYSKLVVKKDSIIWWDFNNHHNLNLVSEEDYSKNESKSNIPIQDNLNTDKNMNIVVTIMDKIGIFYFLCSIGNHALKGHKIIIEVIN